MTAEIKETNQLQGKVAVITGAGRGLGQAVAEAYDAEGAIVVVSDIDGDSAERVAASLRHGEAAVCDVRDEAAVQALMDGIVARHGTLDVAVANAGIAKVQPIAASCLADWRMVTSVNLDGVFLTLRSAALAMAATGGGSIIGMASITGMRGSPLVADYAASKAAVINLCKTAAVEFRDQGVRVNSICPTFIDTDLVHPNIAAFEAALGARFDDVLAGKQGRWSTPSDVTPLAVFLAGDQSRFSTGSNFVVDNGWTASLL